MAFSSINKQFPTIDAFSAWLATLPRPAWPVVGTTYHNTYKPTEAQWRGLASMQSMQEGYEAKGWTRGPHCYLALHSPQAADNGIWVMTPPTLEGVHGVTCNPTHFGVEVVGDFQVNPPSAAQQVLLIDAVAALHRWAKIGPVLNAHRDCVDRTCPGDAFYLLKAKLQERLAFALSADPWPLRWGPIAQPQGGQWAWANVQIWKQYWGRLGQCRSNLLYDNANRVICQHFEKGVTRSLDNNQTWEVCVQ